MTSTNVWRYAGIVVLVLGALVCVSYITQYNGDVDTENKNFVVLQETMIKMQEKMLASEQKVGDLLKVVNEMKDKVEAPVRVVEKQVFLLDITTYIIK